MASEILQSIELEDMLKRFGQLMSIDVDTEYCKVSRIGEGESNLNYLVDMGTNCKYNLRMVNPQKLKNQLENEAIYLSIIEGDFAPKLLASDLEKIYFDRPVIVIEYIDGVTLLDWPTENFLSWVEALASFHNLHKLTEKTPFDIMSRFEAQIKLSKAQFKYSTYGLYLDELCDSIIQYFSSEQQSISPYYETIVHGDMHRYNIIFNSQNRARFIDLEIARIDDPAIDLSKLVWPFSTHWQFSIRSSDWVFYLKVYESLVCDREVSCRVRLWQIYIMFFDLLYHSDCKLNKDSNRMTASAIFYYLQSKFL